MPAPAESICVGMYFAGPVLDLEVIVGEEEGPPGEFRVFGFGSVKMLQRSMISDYHELYSSQVGMKLGDCKHQG